VDLTSVSFADQRCLLRDADILVAVAGTAIHNILFMQSGAAVVSE
jgi:capsular polysaccharide biosynthesis protein